MSSRDALMRRVLEAPDDDGPRLVLADWLLEHGEEQAGELIATQCEMARRQEAGEDEGEDYLNIVARQRALYDGQEQVWRARLKGLVHHLWLERGFPERVSMRLTSFEELLPGVKKLTPVRVLRLLAFSDDLDGDRWRRVATSPLVAELDGLELIRLLGDEQDLRILLADDCRLFHLRRLSLAENHLETGALGFLGSRPWRSLTRLDLSSAIRDEEGLVALLEGSGMANLRWLGLLGLNIESRGAEALARASSLTRMRSLHVRRLTDRAVAVLAGATHLSSLRELGVWHSQVGDDGVRAIAASPVLRNLEALSLEGGTVSDEGLAALGCAGLPNLRRLTLEDNRITDSGVRAIVASESLSRLRHLNLKRNRIGAEMKRALREHYGPGVCTFSR